MINLKKQEGQTIELPGGAVLILRPVTTPSYEAARAVAERTVRELRETPEKAAELGFQADDFANDDTREGIYLAHLIGELGVRHITAWEGIGDDDGLAPVTPENIRKLLCNPVAARVFYRNVTSGLFESFQLKKDLGPVANGTSSAEPAPSTATDAKTPD